MNARRGNGQTGEKCQANTYDGRKQQEPTKEFSSRNSQKEFPN